MDISTLSLRRLRCLPGTLALKYKYDFFYTECSQLGVIKIVCVLSVSAKIKCKQYCPFPNLTSTNRPRLLDQMPKSKLEMRYIGICIWF